MRLPDVAGISFQHMRTTACCVHWLTMTMGVICMKTQLLKWLLKIYQTSLPPSHCPELHIGTLYE